jgi:hypothetical protein
MAKQDRSLEATVADKKLQVGLGAFIFVDYKLVLAILSLNPATG